MKQVFLSFIGAALIGLTAPVAPSQTPATATQISINGAGSGRTFDGVGALSAGASSRLLIDYPPKQRAEILDYLFKPDFGAALQINKIEIGADTNSTDGAEPSHMRTSTDHGYHRGYEWWLMQESKKRNPSIKLYGLEWGAPGWINPDKNDVWTTSNLAYILYWLRHAKSDYGLNLDYLGGWNERGYNKSWYENYRRVLNANGFAGIKIVADDSYGWKIGKDADDDPAFAAASDIIGQHYPDDSPRLTNDVNWQASLHSGKPLWGSEIGSQPYDTGAGNLAKTYNQGYINGRMTAFINWSTIWSVYSPLPYPGDGLMLADEPWSGHYVVGQSIWVTAQTTQFAHPGWQYLNSACGYFGGSVDNGSYVTLKAPNNRDFSIIAETIDAKSSQQATCTISGGLSPGTVHVWRTNLRSAHAGDWFSRQSDIQPINGTFSLLLQPDCVYSLTTTTGQAKGRTSPPPSRPLALPYRDDFHEYAEGATPRLFSDQQGAFEVPPAGGGHSGKCLRQVITTKPIEWAGDSGPTTVVGDPNWTNYEVRRDVRLEQPGSLGIIGRFCSSGGNNVIDGYRFRLASDGHWLFLRRHSNHDVTLASGNHAFPVGTWHRVIVSFAGDKMGATVDGAAVFANLVDDSYPHGLVGYEVSQYRNADFQNLAVLPIQVVRSQQRQRCLQSRSRR